MIKIGITHGDINGVSYELILKAFSDSRILELFTPVIYGSPKVAAYHRKTLELQQINMHQIDRAEEIAAGRINMINCLADEIKVELGKPTPESTEAAFISCERAMADIQQAKIDALVTLPTNIGALQRNGQVFTRHSDFLEARLGKIKESLSILVNGSLRIALATDEMPLSTVASTLSSDLIYKKLLIFRNSLIRDFAITMPRIAVLAFNPNVDSKSLGHEEKEMIVPAIERASKDNVYALGPFAADTFFGSDSYTKYDGIMAMYYDQGMLPFKTLSVEDGVCFSAGLPVIHTMPNHGPFFDLVGKNTASYAAFLSATYLAIDVYNNRKIHREITANPLRKQYVEKGSDNEKLDLTSDNISL